MSRIPSFIRHLSPQFNSLSCGVFFSSVKRICIDVFSKSPFLGFKKISLGDTIKKYRLLQVQLIHNCIYIKFRRTPKKESYKKNKNSGLNFLERFTTIFVYRLNRLSTSVLDPRFFCQGNVLRRNGFKRNKSHILNKLSRDDCLCSFQNPIGRPTFYPRPSELNLDTNV